MSILCLGTGCVELFIICLMKKKLNIVAINAFRIRTTAPAEDYYSTLQNCGRTDLQLINQQKGVFNSRPNVEIEYSSFLFIFLSLNEKRKMKLNSRFSFKKICFLIFYFQY